MFGDHTAELGSGDERWCVTSTQLDSKGGVYCMDCDIAPAMTDFKRRCGAYNTADGIHPVYFDSRDNWDTGQGKLLDLPAERVAGRALLRNEQTALQSQDGARCRTRSSLRGGCVLDLGA